MMRFYALLRGVAWLPLAVLLSAPSLGGCRYDPVPQELIDDLPPEDMLGPSAMHRAGQPCVLCHSEYEGADPAMTVGGTVFELNPATSDLIAVNGVRVYIYDANGASQLACTNAAGNFYIEKAVWDDAAFPLSVQVGNRFMRSLIGRDGSCATCHSLARGSQIDPSSKTYDESVDPLTGASRSSAGAVLVKRSDLSPLQSCLPPSGTGGEGGGGGAGGGAGGSAGGGAGEGGTGGTAGGGGR